jgi:hypothetical protein
MVLSAFLALRAKNRAFRSKSSEAPMRFLWAFRFNPWRAPSGRHIIFMVHFLNRAVWKPQFPNRLGNGFNIKPAGFAAILRQIRQTCERTGRLSNKSN